MRSAARFDDLLHCLEQVAARIWRRLYARGIEPTSVLQLVLCIETEKIGRALSVIGARDLLRRIDHIWESKTVLAQKTPSYCQRNLPDRRRCRLAL